MLHLRPLETDGQNRGFIPISICFPRKSVRQNLSCFFPSGCWKSFWSFLWLYRSLWGLEIISLCQENLFHSYSKHLLTRWTWLHFLISLFSLSATDKHNVRGLSKRFWIIPRSIYYITYFQNRNIYPSWQLVLTLNHGKISTNWLGSILLVHLASYLASDKETKYLIGWPIYWTFEMELPPRFPLLPVAFPIWEWKLFRRINP